MGIGTTTPTGTYGKLTVAGGISILNDSNAKLEIGRYSSGVSNSYIKLGANSDSLRITNNTDVADIFTITNSGSVGIGTTSPIEKLDVTKNGNQNDVNWGSIMIRNIANYAIGNDASIGFALNNSTNSNCDPRASIGCKTESNLGGALVFNTRNDAGYNEKMRITKDGVVQPGANGTQDLGTTSLRWATIYTSDLSLSNGIGDYTIVEGENDLFLYNNKQNKVYKFLLAEVDPADATPKKS